LKGADLPLHDLYTGGLLLRVTPVEIKPGFDARSEQQGRTGFATDLLGLALGQLRHDSHDGAGCVAEQVDRVLNPPGSH